MKIRLKVQGLRSKENQGTFVAWQPLPCALSSEIPVLEPGTDVFLFHLDP